MSYPAIQVCTTCMVLLAFDHGQLALNLCTTSHQGYPCCSVIFWQLILTKFKKAVDITSNLRCLRCRLYIKHVIALLIHHLCTQYTSAPSMLQPGFSCATSETLIKRQKRLGNVYILDTWVRDELCKHV